MSRTQRGDCGPASSMGYTLIELVIVMVVLGVLAAVAGPRFFTQQTFSDRGYADELGAALRATQKAAVISGCAARLTIGASSYAAAQQAAAGNSCDQADTSWSTAIVGPDGAALQGSAPSGTTASPTGVFQFDGRGRLSVSPATTIAVGGRSITIEPGTGFIQVL